MIWRFGDVEIKWFVSTGWIYCIKEEWRPSGDEFYFKVDAQQFRADLIIHKTDVFCTVTAGARDWPEDSPFSVRQMPTTQPLVCNNTAPSSCSPLLTYEESLQLCQIAGVELRLQRRDNRQNNELLSSHGPADGRWLISAMRNTYTAKIHRTYKTF